MASSVPTNVQLVINADDFGHCEGRNRGIVECYRNGLISSASLMVNARQTAAAVKEAKTHGIPIGLHLNLTEGRPTTRGRCDSLLDKQSGNLLGKFGFREALASGTIDKDELREEIHSQFQTFKELTGHKPTHVDGHQHVHVLQGVREILGDIAREFRVSVVRIPIQEDSIASQQFFGQVIEDAKEARTVFKEKGLRFPDGYFGMTTSGCNMTVSTMVSALETALRCASKTPRSDPTSPVTVEYMVHPGYSCQPGCVVDGEDFFCFDDRAHEMRMLGEDEWKEAIRNAGAKLCSFECLV